MTVLASLDRQALSDPENDFIWGKSGIDDQRIGRLLQNRQLAIKQFRSHEMVPATGEPLTKYVGRAFQIDQSQGVAEPLLDYSPIPRLQHRTGHHSRLVHPNLIGNGRMQPFQPRASIGIG